MHCLQDRIVERFKLKFWRQSSGFESPPPHCRGSRKALCKTTILSFTLSKKTAKLMKYSFINISNNAKIPNCPFSNQPKHLKLSKYSLTTEKSKLSSYSAKKFCPLIQPVFNEINQTNFILRLQTAWNADFINLTAFVLVAILTSKTLSI